MPKIIISEPGKTPQPYRLETDRIVTNIGRGDDNDIIMSSESASTNHCSLKRVEGGFILIDNDSTNGIKFEDYQYSIIDLKDGMTVLIGGDVEMDFTLTDEEHELLLLEDFVPQQRASFPKSSPVPESTDPTTDDEDDFILEEAPIKSTESNNFDHVHEENVSRVKADSDMLATLARRTPAKSKTGCGFLIFIILAILFFVGGLAVRHYKEHTTIIFSK